MEQTNANSFEGSEWPDQDEDFGEFEEDQLPEEEEVVQGE